MRYIRKVWESHYCKIVFFISIIISYLLIPQAMFHNWYDILLSILFMILFSATITCVIRNIKERVSMAKTSTESLISVIAVAIGIASMQVCLASAPVCGAAVGFGLLAMVLPTFALKFLSEYGTVLLIFSIIIQGISLYYMDCFKEMVKTKFEVKI